MPTRQLICLIRCFPALLLAGCAAVSAPPFVHDPLSPLKLERFVRAGPVQGVVARIDLADPRVVLKVALTDATDPDGDGPCVGQLDTTSSAARRHDFALTMNASFFAAPHVRELPDRGIRYFVGNCAIPEGWHVADGKVFTRPKRDNLRATLVIHESGRVSFIDNATELPPDALHAVSGNVQMLKAGQVTPPARDAARHPRSAVGLTADGKTLLLVVVDGRQPGSVGVTLRELAELMLEFGAMDAVNLDGGGSTALVVKDPATGVFSVANQPSDSATLPFPLRAERPVADVIGVRLKDRGP